MEYDQIFELMMLKNHNRMKSLFSREVLMICNGNVELGHIGYNHEFLAQYQFIYNIMRYNYSFFVWVSPCNVKMQIKRYLAMYLLCNRLLHILIMKLPCSNE